MTVTAPGMFVESARQGADGTPRPAGIVGGTALCGAALAVLVGLGGAAPAGHRVGAKGPSSARAASHTSSAGSPAASE